MNALRLLWIIPLTSVFSFVLGAIMATGKKADVV